MSLININGLGTTELYSHKSTILSVIVSPWNNRVISTATDQSFIAYDIVDESILFESILPSNAFDLTLSGEKDVVFHDKMGMIYVLDMTSPNGVFMARDFAIRDADTVYVTEAPYTQFSKVLISVLGPLQNAASLDQIIN